MNKSDGDPGLGMILYFAGRRKLDVTNGEDIAACACDDTTVGGQLDQSP